MRDPKRIGMICRALEEVWLIAPDLRLGQLIVNITGDDRPFYVEDDVTLERLVRVAMTGDFTLE